MSEQGQFSECSSPSSCGHTHVRWESEEQGRMVAECRARAERQRQESSERRERFRRTGVWK